MANLVPFGRGRGLSRGFDDFYSMMEDFFNDPWFGGWRSREGFKLDIQRTDKEYLVEAELPGVRKDEISLDLREGTLTISVHREENKNEENRNYIHRERRVSSMSRSVYLGDVDPDGVAAKLENGVLMINVPSKTPAEKSRRIEIQ